MVWCVAIFMVHSNILSETVKCKSHVSNFAKLMKKYTKNMEKPKMHVFNVISINFIRV
jgi:hypothetical protein